MLRMHLSDGLSQKRQQDRAAPVVDDAAPTFHVVEVRTYDDNPRLCTRDLANQVRAMAFYILMLKLVTRATVCNETCFECLLAFFVVAGRRFQSRFDCGLVCLPITDIGAVSCRSQEYQE